MSCQSLAAVRLRAMVEAVALLEAACIIDCRNDALDGPLVARAAHWGPRFRRRTSNTANIARTSASSRFTSGICDIVIRTSATAFCPYCLTVSSGIPVRKTVRESPESGELQAVRFPPPSLIRSAGDHFRANQKLGSNETPFSGPRKAFTIRPHDDRSPGVSEPIARSA